MNSVGGVSSETSASQNVEGVTFYGLGRKPQEHKQIEVPNPEGVTQQKTKIMFQNSEYLGRKTLAKISHKIKLKSLESLSPLRG